MAFVNEKCELERTAEHEKYAALYKKATGRQISFLLHGWTIDREREMLLVCTHKVRQDMYEGDFELSMWVFYWHGVWIDFTQQGSLGGMITKYHYKKTRKIIEMHMPDTIRHRKLELFRDLEEAFNVYKIVGAWDHEDYRCDLAMDYSDVI